MSLVATVNGIDSAGIAFARTLVADAPTRRVNADPRTLGDLLTNLDAELLVIPPWCAEDLIMEAPCVVAVVSPGEPRSTPVRTVGVASEGTRSSDHAERWAAALAERMHAELIPLRVADGDPEAQLVTACEGIDVLVIGCGHPDRHSVAARVAARAPTPVVVVPLDVAVANRS
jgi:nucleotide-binding universal stress UspA family protein